MKIPALRFFADGGHGWLRVPKSLILKLKIGHLITPYSYMTAKYVFLEEDQDLSTFFKAIDLSGEDNYVERQSFWNKTPTSYARDHQWSHVRYYPKYEYDTQTQTFTAGTNIHESTSN